MPRFLWASSEWLKRTFAFQACSRQVYVLVGPTSSDAKKDLGAGEGHFTFRKGVFSPFFMRFSINCKACFMFWLSMAS